MVEYRGIAVHERVNLYNKNGSFNKKVKDALDSLADALKERGHQLLSAYQGDRERVLIEFNCGHESHPVKPNNYKTGGGCPKCSRQKSTQVLIDRSKNFQSRLLKKLETNGHELLSPYNSENILIDFKCEHEPHWIRPQNYYKLNQGCPKCGYIKTANAKKTKSEAEFLALLKQNGHENLSPYITNREEVLIDFKCEHEPKWVTPNAYKSGNRCGECKFIRMAATKTKPHREKFVKMVELNGHLLLSEYITSKDKVLIDFKCGHEPEWMVAFSYKKGHRCQLCANLKINQELAKRTGKKFALLVKKNNHILLSPYERDEAKLLIDFKCGHDPHWITPHNYKQGNRCPNCTNSKGVRAICEWLKENMIEHETEFHLPNRIWRYDIFIPSKKLIVEVHGLQHYEDSYYNKIGRSLREQQLTDREKRKYAGSLGYDYIEVDYREHNPELALERFITDFCHSKAPATRKYEQLNLF